MITYRKNKYYLLMIITTINKKDEFRMKFRPFHFYINQKSYFR